MTRVGVVTFPGSLDDQDAARAVSVMGLEAVPLWHAAHDLEGVDAVILPGGFSYGDYLRCGAIARFSPIMSEVIKAADDGLPVLGICNGFQVLCESHLLPGALIRNDRRTFVCRDQRLQVVSRDTVWTCAMDEGQEIEIACLAFRITTFVCSVSAFACFARSRLLSSVRGGTFKIITSPLLEGAKPRLELIIAFSIGPIADLSHGWIEIVIASGTDTLAT